MNGATTGRDEPGANAGAEVQPVVSVETDQHGIEAVSSWRVAADDKFLGKLDAHLGPGAGSFSLLVGAGEAFGYNTLHTMAPNQFKHLLGSDG